MPHKSRTASDRSALIRLASTMPVGAPERKALLAGLTKKAMPLRPPEELYAVKEIENAGRLSNVDPVLAKYLVHTGLDDGSASDDKVSVKPAVFGAASLKPSQTTIKLWGVVGMALMMIRKGKIGGNLGAIISSDNYIMDGHHRWAATILAGGPDKKVGGFQAAIPGKELIKVLNIITKGLFKVPAGNKGTGNITNVNPDATRALLEQYVVEGIKGEYPVSAEQVRKDLTTGFGSVERGIEVMSDRAKLVRKTVPSWAPVRSDMPVIEPEEAPEAAKLLDQGKINWRLPILTEKERVAMVRLASTMEKGSPERKTILSGLRKSAGVR